MAGDGREWDDRLREAGLRSTVARRAVLQALAAAGHATVDELAEAVQRTRPEVNLSTIYRTLEALDEAGLVTHAHLHHGSPTYHSVDADPHVHLVCSECGQVEEQPASVARNLAQHLLEATGFTLDVAHLAVHGTCARCSAAGPGDGSAGSAGGSGSTGAAQALTSP
jgi:Fur family ferric uptake transcriptional regulator